MNKHTIPSRQHVGLSVAECGFQTAGNVYDDLDLLGGLIREAFLQLGLGRISRDAPLCDILRPGATVLIKPNWVLHRNEGGHGMDCMVTHPAFILAVLAEAMKANPARVVIADAPVQSCQWSELVSEGFCRRAAALARAAGADLDVVDLRRTAMVRRSGECTVESERRPMDRYVLVDTGTDSLLESVSSPAGRFRVTQYDPREMARTHRPGRHLFLLAKEAFEADVILSLPKLKLHRKAGLTGALKNLVGLNGSKEFLPHHRAGGQRSGGDCYAGRSVAKRAAEVLLDRANRQVGTPRSASLSRLAYRVAGEGLHDSCGGLEGAWHGNDTCWRMVLDLNRIVMYGRADGTLADVPQRTLWSVTDAIVCGQGEGPLSPQPLELGAVTASAGTVAADGVHAALMQLDPAAIPLIRSGFGDYRWPLAEPGDELDSTVVCCKGRRLSLFETAAEYGRPAVPPKGWAGQVEWRAARAHCNSAR